VDDALGKLINHSIKNVSLNERKMLFKRYFIKPTAIIFELVAQNEHYLDKIERGKGINKIC
jgi:hypothetical protein